MKNYSLILLFTVVLTGCGQTGPLYLPDAPPPIHVAKPKPEPEKPKAEPVTPSKTEPVKTK
jgi:predicted small lipoprotein YifL